MDVADAGQRAALAPIAPSRRIRPDVGRQIESRILTSVVLPARFGPIRPNTSPAEIDRLTRSRARTPPRPKWPGGEDLGHILEADDLFQPDTRMHLSILLVDRKQPSRLELTFGRI